MKNIRLIFLVLWLAAIPAIAQPVVNAGGVVNAASFTPQVYPNSGIAQGSVFSIFGTGLGPAKFVGVGSFPLPTNLGGSSVAVTVNGTTVDAILFYTVAGQINALMPSKTPIGTGTLTVTYNNQTSAPAPVQVVANNFGIFTVASSGSGPGVLTNGKNQANGYTFAANPGEILNIWGTGLGASSGPDDEPPITGNITANSPTIYLGGVQITPLYHGRSGCCAGVDQIQIQIPQNITGCSVPLAIQTGSTVSNFVSISVAQSGQTCSDEATGLSGSTYQEFFTKGSASIGSVQLERFQVTETLPPPEGTGASETITQDFGVANFSKDTFYGASISGLPFSIANFGACSVFVYQQTSNSSSPTAPGAFQSVGLDAGSPLTINGPNGNQTMTTLTAGTYYTAFGSSLSYPGSSPLYLSPGSYTISGPGGQNVGAFNVALSVPQPLDWTNQSSLSTIARANGLTVKWTGGDPNGYLVVAGSSATGPDSSNLSAAEFLCFAKVSDGQFTVPSVVLLSLPPSAILQDNGSPVPTGSVSLISESQPVTFTASGLDLGFASSGVFINQTVTFQ